MSRNLRLPCTIELQPLSLTRLKMRKVELSKFLAKLPRLWRQGEVRPTHAARMRGPRHWRTGKDPFEGVCGNVLVWLQAENRTPRARR